jgi:hypothetical protein
MNRTGDASPRKSDWGGLGPTHLKQAALALPLLACAGCRDLSSFSTSGGSYEGPVVQASFVLAGVDAGTDMCITLDTDQLQDVPGTLSTSDGRFQMVPMRSIPQLWQDPLSTLTFGEGRLKNIVYVVTATTPYGDGNGNDAFIVVSLMQSGNVEVRLLRGAPGIATGDGGGGGPGGNVFAVFQLARQPTPCSY